MIFNTLVTKGRAIENINFFDKLIFFLMSKKRFRLVRLFHQLLHGFLTIGHLSRMSRQSRLWANNKGDNEVKPRAEHRTSRRGKEERRTFSINALSFSILSYLSNHNRVILLLLIVH
jgi:hypothetical protein